MKFIYFYYIIIVLAFLLNTLGAAEKRRVSAQCMESWSGCDVHEYCMRYCQFNSLPQHIQFACFA